MEVEERLEAAVGGFGLIRCVRRVPAGILDDVALDHLWGEGVVVPHPDVGAVQLVLRREPAQRLEDLAFGAPGRERQRAPQADVVGHDGVDEGIERVISQGRQHVPRLIGTGPDMTRHEPIGGGERSAYRRHRRKARIAPQERVWDCPGSSTTTWARRPTWRLKASGSALITSNVL